MADFNTAPLMEVELANINDIPKSNDKEQKVPDLESQAISVGRKAFGIDEFCQLFGVEANDDLLRNQSWAFAGAQGRSKNNHRG